MKSLKEQNQELTIRCAIKQQKPLKNGEVPIFIRITLNGNRDEFSLKRSTPVKYWNKKTCRVSPSSHKATDINTLIEDIINKIKVLREYLESEGIEVTPTLIKEKIIGHKKKRHTVVTTFKKHNDNARALIGKDFAAATVQRYDTTLSHFKQFIKLKYKREDMAFVEITPEVISDFEFYFKIERNCAHNTTLKYLKNFKKVIIIALQNGWLKSDPFKGKKYKLETIDAIYLDKEELQRLKSKIIKIERLERVRDIYIFCCYTGLAFADVKSLCKSDITKDSDGISWIHKYRQKTKQKSTIYLLDEAKSIIDKYANTPAISTSDKVLNVPTNQKLNSYLKELADICHINKNISSHSARHTFATTVTLGNNIPIEVVSKMLGHSTIKMTQRYARTTEELIKKNMSRITVVS